ncbi:DUF5694 domain-containing protein [Faecalibacter rhinopitheci]|uniref:TraB/GumN family protein n=1 Tax=Faecalibacter rhinopitheci TaxID=2779678 RepID=A0A8J7FQL9_9FLAO|nr:DUF5694 domain-containing protein [Faecalibacter rhinopitheci]MBF0596488.1 hypothetical protein [Faecalibacter rhinopitheci]
MKNILITLFTILCSVQLFAQSNYKKEPIEVLIIGTFHFSANSGVTKTNKLDINDAKTQEELEVISNQIAAFKPNQFFVEWEAENQNNLDEHYKAYLKDEYVSYLEKNDPKYTKFYLENEFAQIGFKTGKKANISKMEGIDFQTGFTYDSVIKTAELNKQQDLLLQIDQMSLEYKNLSNELMKSKSMIQVLKSLNTEKIYNLDMKTYIEGINQIGNENNFAGAYLVSELYRRNLYMISLIQKKIKPETKRIAVLVGNSHAGFFTEILKYDSRFKIINLNEIIK